MTIGYDIQLFLQTAGITGISVNDVSTISPNTISIMETGGFQPSRTHGVRAHADIIRPSFQIILRRATKAQASETITQLSELLDGVLMQTINGNLYLSITQTTPAIFLGQVRTEAGDTNEYSLNFETQVQRRQT